MKLIHILKERIKPLLRRRSRFSLWEKDERIALRPVNPFAKDFVREIRSDMRKWHYVHRARFDRDMVGLFQRPRFSFNLLHHDEPTFRFSLSCVTRRFRSVGLALKICRAALPEHLKDANQVGLTLLFDEALHDVSGPVVILE